MPLDIVAEHCYDECRLCWLSLYWVQHINLCWVSLCRVSFCWVSLCWVPLCWVSLCWVSLCWVSLCWAECLYAELSVFMLCVFMLSVFMLSVIMLSDVMLIIVAPSTQVIKTKVFDDLADLNNFALGQIFILRNKLVCFVWKNNFWHKKEWSSFFLTFSKYLMVSTNGY